MITMAPRPPMHDFTNIDDDDERNLRELRAALSDNVGLDEISYPIAPIDTCDCVSFPYTSYTISECTDVYWGTFRFHLTDGSCYDVSFDESLVYQDCPSGASLEQEAEYVLCEIDFIEETDSLLDENNFATESETETTRTSNLRQEGAGDTKKTHIHFTVHRLLSLVLEGLLALQYPS
ncbi:hypothetical protein DVH05_020028 [Phytophthora capsici]|nr:hypothetical protein DVH05_020028 [Phytophthora capsici]